MRIYIPLVAAELTSTTIAQRLAHGVTADLVRAVPDEDLEGHELIAFLAAADDSLRMLTSTDVARRLVASAEVPTDRIELPARNEDVLPTAVHLVGDVQWSEVESIHVDESDAEELLRRAIAGDDAAFEQSVELDMLWHDVLERDRLAEELLGK